MPISYRSDGPIRSFPALRALRWLWIGGTAWVVGTAAAAAWRASWMTVVFDQWPRLRVLLERPFPAGVLAESNGHRQILPGLLYLIDLHWFGAHNRFLRVVGMALCFATAALLSAVVTRDRETPPLVRTVAACWIWLGVFWLANVRNLGHPFETTHVYLLTAAFALAILLVERSATTRPDAGEPRVWALTACCLVATFSFGQGAAVWVVVLGLGVASRWPPRRLLPLAAGLALSVVVYVWVLPGDEAVRHALSFDLGETPASTALWLGAPAFHVIRSWVRTTWATASRSALPLGGAAAVAVGVVALRRAVRRRPVTGVELVGLALSGFGVGAAVITNLARTAYYRDYPGQILADRYLVFSTLFWVGCMLLVGSAACRSRRPRLAVSAWVVVSALLVLAAGPVHRDFLARHLERKALSEQAEIGLVVGAKDDAAVGRYLFRDPDVVYAVAAMLRRRRLAMFDEPAARRLGEALDEHCQLAGGGARGRVLEWEPLPAGGTRIEGWVVEDDGRPPDHVVVVDGRGLVRGLGQFTPPGAVRSRRTRRTGREAPTFVAYLEEPRRRRAYRTYAVLSDGATCVELPRE